MKKRFWDGLLVLLLIALDQITKYLAFSLLKGNAAYPVAKGIFELSYLENTGAAFGSFTGSTVFLAATTAVLIAVVVWKYGQIPLARSYTPLRAAFLIIIAGGIGNLADRMFRGYVIDFLYFVPIDFPKFNFADIYVTLGAIGFLLLATFIYKEESDLAFLWKIKP